MIFFNLNRIFMWDPVLFDLMIAYIRHEMNKEPSIMLHASSCFTSIAQRNSEANLHKNGPVDYVQNYEEQWERHLGYNVNFWGLSRRFRPQEFKRSVPTLAVCAGLKEKNIHGRTSIFSIIIEDQKILTVPPSSAFAVPL